MDACTRERGQDSVEVFLLTGETIDLVEEDDVAAAGEGVIEKPIQAFSSPPVPGAARKVEILVPADDGPAARAGEAGDLITLDLGADHLVSGLGDPNVAVGAHDAILQGVWTVVGVVSGFPTDTVPSGTRGVSLV